MDVGWSLCQSFSHGDVDYDRVHGHDDCVHDYDHGRGYDDDYVHDTHGQGLQAPVPHTYRPQVYNHTARFRTKSVELNNWYRFPSDLGQVGVDTEDIQKDILIDTDSPDGEKEKEEEVAAAAAARNKVRDRSPVPPRDYRDSIHPKVS